MTEALEELRRRNLLGYSEKHGYKLQSSAGEEWERERRDIPAPREAISEIVQEGLRHLLAIPDRPQYQGRSFPWAGRFSDGRRADDVSLLDPRDAAAVVVDFRYLLRRRAHREHVGEEERRGRTPRPPRLGVRRHRGRRRVRARAAPLARHGQQVQGAPRLAEPRPQAPAPAGGEPRRGPRQAHPGHHRGGVAGRADCTSGAAAYRHPTMAATFAVALHQAANRVLPDLFPHFIATQVAPSELLQLVEAELSGPSPKFLTGDLGILELDAGRFVPSCGGVVVRRVQDYIESEGGCSGTALLARFGGPPYGYTANVVKACVAGLLRATKVRVQPEGGDEITAIRDAGVRDLFERDRDFRRATILPGGQDDIGPQSRARICKFFEVRLGAIIDRDNDQIANAVVQHFPALARQLRDVQGRLSQLPGSPPGPAALGRLGEALEKCLRNPRQTRPTVQAVKSHLDALQDGVFALQLYGTELTADAILAVKDAHRVLAYEAAQLTDAGIDPVNVTQAVTRVSAHLDGGPALARHRRARPGPRRDPRLLQLRAAAAAPVAGAAGGGGPWPRPGTRRLQHPHGRSGAQRPTALHGGGHRHHRRGGRATAHRPGGPVHARAAARREPGERPPRRDTERWRQPAHRPRRPAAA